MSFLKSDPPVPKENLAPELINKWKLKLSMEEIMTIEAKCGSVLNRLEYPIYGSHYGSGAQLLFIEFYKKFPNYNVLINNFDNHSSNSIICDDLKQKKITHIF